VGQRAAETPGIRRYFRFGSLGIFAGLQYVVYSDCAEEESMANGCGGPPAPPAGSEPVKPGTRMVHCVKFGKELPGLDRVPWKGEIGKRVYESVSKDAWKLWLEHSKMLMNEYRLNPLDPNSQKIMEEQLEQFFFGEGAKLPEGYVAPKAKG
jgi:Fe-S cluster biosynthesis and repair protein YggX